MKKRIYTFYMVLVAVLLSSCDKEEFLDRPSLDEYSTTSVFLTEADMILASNRLYALLPNPGMTPTGESRFWIWSDDGWRRNRGIEGASLQWNSSDAIFPSEYRYGTIRDCNELIARIPGATFTTPGLAERMEAEARFIRAFAYERMVFVYGDVPLVTEPQLADFFPSRDDRQVVFDFVVNELKEIANILPDSYTGADGGRVTKWAASALLARTYLNAIGWHPNAASLYSEAQTVLLDIVNNSPHQLDAGANGFRNLFRNVSDVGGSAPSNEVMFSRNYVGEELTYQGLVRRCLPRGSYIGTGIGAAVNLAQYGAAAQIIDAFQTTNGLAPIDDVTYDVNDPYSNRDPRLKISFTLPGDQLLWRSGTGSEFYTFQPDPGIINPVNHFPNDKITHNQGQDTGYLIRKYAGLDENGALEYLNNERPNADYIYLRYAEVLLMLAETYAAANDEGNTLLYVNEVRARVGMPAYNSIADVPIASVGAGTTGNALIDAVLLERRYEFAGEAPYRWMDIWRYRLGDQVYGPIYGMPVAPTPLGSLDIADKSTTANHTRVWDEKFYLFPIPQAAIDRNENLLPQNPGW